MRKQTFQFLTVGLFFILSTSQTLFSQILQSRSDIIKDEGSEYESGTTEDGTKYIVYKTESSSEQSGTYTRHKIIYFTTMDSGEEVCNLWKILEPSSETNPNVTYFKKNLVEIEYMKWKDYETNILYKIKVEEGICIITAWYDYKKQ